MERPLTVRQLAGATGVPAKTIRYYEQVGVLPAAHRSPAGYRQYSRHDIHRLVFIRRARVLGLSLAQVKVLAAELDGDGCAAEGGRCDMAMLPRDIFRPTLGDYIGAVQRAG